MIVERLIKEGAVYEVHVVVAKAVHLCEERCADGQPVRSAIQNAHKLFEAMGELTQTYVAYHFAYCKFNLYKMAAVSKRQRIDLVHYLKDAVDYTHKAIQLTKEDQKPHDLADQYCLLGYIHSELLVINKSTAEQVISFYEKAQRYNSQIKINQESIPLEYRSQFKFQMNHLHDELSPFLNYLSATRALLLGDGPHG